MSELEALAPLVRRAGERLASETATLEVSRVLRASGAVVGNEALHVPLLVLRRASPELERICRCSAFLAEEALSAGPAARADLLPYLRRLQGELAAEERALVQAMDRAVAAAPQAEQAVLKGEMAAKKRALEDLRDRLAGTIEDVGAGKSRAVAQAVGKEADAIARRLADLGRSVRQAMLARLRPERLVALMRDLGEASHVFELAVATADRMVENGGFTIEALRRKYPRDPATGLAALPRFGTSESGYLSRVAGEVNEGFARAGGASNTLAASHVFDVLAELGPEGQAAYDVVQLTGAAMAEGKQLGDGMTVLVRKGSQTGHLVVLEEYKTYIPEQLWRQLFVRSDRDIARSIWIEGRDAQGNLVKLLLEPPPQKVRQLYIFARPVQEGAEAINLPARVLGGLDRNVFEYTLPQTRMENRQIAWEMLLAALEKAGAGGK